MPAWLDALSVWTVSFINSNLVTAVIGFAGALSGARAAQKLAERAKLRDELQKEVRDSGASAILIYAIASRHLGLKQQHVKEIRDKYSEQRGRFETFLQAKAAGTVPPQQVFEYDQDNYTLKPLHAPTEQIEKLVFEQTSLSGAIVVTTHTMLSAFRQLNECIEDRNQLIKQIEEQQAAGKPFSPFRYFGIREGNIVDLRYSTNVENIYTQNDDVIAFSITIGDKLYDHAIRKREELRKRFKVQGPEVSKLSFDHLSEYLPPAANYKEAFSIFDADTKAQSEAIQRFWRRFGIKRVP